MKAEPPFDVSALRRALGAFLTGVTVVTTRSPAGAAVGMTANSFTSVSLDPPLVLVCIGNGSSNFPAFENASGFAVNILREGQHEVASRFAARVPDRFAGLAHRPVQTGSPVLTDSLAWFDCTLHQRLVAGDHLVLIGRVRAFDSGDAPPLGFSRGRYVTARAHHEPGETGTPRLVRPPGEPWCTPATQGGTLRKVGVGG